MGTEVNLDFETRVKRLVVSLGLRHRNRVAEVRALGNGVDTTRRRAWFRFGIRWTRAVSPALCEEMGAAVQFPPSVQAYASDVDAIDIELVSLAQTHPDILSPPRGARADQMEGETPLQLTEE